MYSTRTGHLIYAFAIPLKVVHEGRVYLTIWAMCDKPIKDKPISPRLTVTRVTFQPGRRK
jgi:hypothetical protein